MKILILLASIGLANVGLSLTGDGFLIWQGSTNDQWRRDCHYYFPFRMFAVKLPLSQSCPKWLAPT